MSQNSKAQEIRFEKEAQALKKNLAKRQKQRQQRQKDVTSNATSKDTKHGQD